MGYSSNYELYIGEEKNGSFEQFDRSDEMFIRIANEFRESCDWAMGTIDENGHPIESQKWYSSDADLAKFSKRYPDLVFMLYREGEENLDAEQIYAKGGVSVNNYIHVFFDPYDPAWFQARAEKEGVMIGEAQESKE